MTEVQQLASKNMAEKMADMEEKSEELRRVTHRKMADMEEKAAEMSRVMRRKIRCMKAEMKRVKAEAYKCLDRERDKINMNTISEKMQTRVAEISKCASRDLRM